MAPLPTAEHSNGDENDDRITTLIRNVPPSSTYFSLEFFPPKTQAGFTNLQGRLARMTTALRPLFVTVTWGAGGSTAVKSLELAEICQRQLGVPTVLHLTCTNGTQKIIDEALQVCKEAGIRNILALRGDPPREEYKDPIPVNGNGLTQATLKEEEEFVWAIDLVKYIRRKHGDYFCIGVAGYPEGHADESHPEAGKQSVDHDLPYLEAKVKAGADFIMTQLTYDVEAYRLYEAKLRSNPLFKTIPIIPGLMPIQSYQIIKRITKLSHSKVPRDISERIEAVKSDDDLVKKLGVDVLSEIVEKIKAMPQPEGIPRGLHFYTLNLEKSVAFILERCKLLAPVSEPESSSDSEAIIDGPIISNGEGHVKQNDHQERRFTRRASSMNAQPHNRVIKDSRSPLRDIRERLKHEAAENGVGIPASNPSRAHNLMISEGQGSLGREATWDDFPNGRWGPSHSPAFGEIDGYGPSLKVGPITARRLWGNPKTAEDITNIFRRHVNGQLRTVPWSDDVDAETSTTGDGALRAETDTIKRELLGLIEKGYWTVASQPSVDGVRSDHPIYGWGPKGEGFCFQKAFVEFFCSSTQWEKLKSTLSKRRDEFSWMKTDADKIFECSEILYDRRPSKIKNNLSSKPIPGTSGINAVTWGVFRGKEIVTPTIIEAESFRAWGEEAFSIWGEWRRCFPRGSQEEQCLEKLRKDIVLVNIVDQNFRAVRAELWKVLLEE